MYSRFNYAETKDLRMLLDELLKKTSKSHPDYMGLSLAAQQIQQVANYINSQKRVHEHKMVKAELQSVFKKKYERVCICDPCADKTQYIEPKGGKPEKIGAAENQSYCFLSLCLLVWKKSHLPTKKHKIALLAPYSELVCNLRFGTSRL